MAEYLRYIIQNTEPLRIADDATSQSGQSSALRYVSGSAVRGFVVSALCEEADFEIIKKSLFADSMVFLNAYPTTKEHILIPSPMGFYEDKKASSKDSDIQNVVIKGDFSDGYKRAGLGSYCYIEGDHIFYYDVKMTSEMKVLVNPSEGQERNVFRNEAISAGHFFEGFIRLSGDKDLDVRIEKLFEAGRTIVLGNARSAGMGKCRVIRKERTWEIPYIKSGFKAEKECYLMVLSDTVMRNGLGELCGLDLDELHRKMGVTDLKIRYASTAVRSVHGYNRTWRARIPAVTAYRAGSVFHLEYTGELNREKMGELCDEGIGIRRNEGFGRILFFQNYENVNKKTRKEYAWSEAETSQKNGTGWLSEQEKTTLKAAAKKYYLDRLERGMESFVVRHPLAANGLRNSKIGNVEARLLKYRYSPVEARKALEEYFAHEKQKEEDLRVHQEKRSVDPLGKQIKEILETSIEHTLFVKKVAVKGKEERSFEDVKKTIMGMDISEFYTPEDEEQIKIELLVKMIRFSRKQGG